MKSIFEYEERLKEFYLKKSMRIQVIFVIVLIYFFFVQISRIFKKVLGS